MPDIMAAHSELGPIRSSLEQLRRRLRGLYALYGLGCLAVEILGFCVVQFLADRLFSLPQPVRLVVLIGSLLALLYAAFRHLIYPLTRPIALKDVALRVEARFRSLEGRLISALELSESASLTPRNVSPELVDRLVADAVTQSSVLPFEEIFWYRRLKQVVMVAGLLLLVAVIHAAVSPLETAVFFRRLFAGSTQWPRRTYLEIEIPRDNPNYTVETSRIGDQTTHKVLVARGASLPVKVLAKGRVPDEVFLIARDQESGAREFEMFRREGEFSYRVRSVRRAMTIGVRGGDDDGIGREIVIDVRTAPLVTKAQAQVTPPSYTGLPASTVADGNLDTPAGTRASLRFQFNVPLKSAGITLGAQAAQPLVLAPDAMSATYDVIVKDSQTYNLSLTGRDGFSNLDPITYTIVCTKDKPPVAKVLDPGRSEIEVTPTALVLMRAQFQDDYGVRTILLRQQLIGANQVVESAAPDSATPHPDPSDSNTPHSDTAGEWRVDPLPGPDVIASTTWDLLQMNLSADDGARKAKAGDALHYSWVVRDNCTDADQKPTPSEVVLKDRRISLVSETEKLRLLTERQVRLKEDVKAVRALQIEKQMALKALVESAGSGDDEIPAAELIAVEIGQNQVTQRSRRISREFADVFEEYLFNRLDHSTPAERLLAAHVENRRAQRAEEGFQPVLFTSLLQSYRQGDYGDLGVLAKLLSMIDLSFAASEVQSPQAYENLSSARVTARRGDRPDLIAGALKTQGLVVESLNQLLQRMDEWEDFQEVLELMREVIDDQRGLNQRFRDALKTKEEIKK